MSNYNNHCLTNEIIGLKNKKCWVGWFDSLFIVWLFILYRENISAHYFCILEHDREERKVLDKIISFLLDGRKLDKINYIM